MNSKYFKNKAKEIKKSKSEMNFHLNFAKINAEKEKHNINIKNELTKNFSSSDNNQISNNNSNSNTSEEITDYNLNENKNYTIKSLDSVNSNTNSKINFNEQNNNSKSYKNIEQISVINSNNDKCCRCCGKKYDDKLHIQIKLKCNHSFCKICLGKYFTEENKIVCPIDGPVNKCEDGLNFLKNNNNKNKGNNKRKNSSNSIQSLIHKSNSHKELLKYKNYYYKKRGHKINLNDKMNNGKNNNKNSLQFLNLTNRNQDLNLNLLSKKYLFNHINKNNSQTKFHKTSYNNKYNEISKSNEPLLKKLPKNKTSRFRRSKSVLNNYYSNSSNIDTDDSSNFCAIHPEQRISHFVEDTKELICIHCAFNKLKNDPNIQIKEIPQKCKEYIADLEGIIEKNKNYIQIIKNSINHINENKQSEEKKIIEIYEELTNLLITNRNNYLIKIEEIYQQNKSTMNKKLESFEEIIDISEKLQDDFSTLQNKAPNEFNFLVQAFNQFVREINDKSNSEIHIIQYNFSHDEANKIIKYINNFADVKSKKKIFKFDLTKTEEDKNNDFDTTIDLSKLINADIQKNAFKKYFKVKQEMVQKNPNNVFNEYYIKNKSSNQYKNNILNYYKDSDNVNELLNKYVSSPNLIRDNIYNESNLKNSKIENNTSDNNNIYKYLKENNEKLNLLKKYKYY